MGSTDLDSLGAFDRTGSAYDVSDHQEPIDGDTSNCDLHNPGFCSNPAAEFKEPALPDGYPEIPALVDTQESALGTSL